MKRIGEISEDVILVTTNIVGLYLSMLLNEGLEVLRERLEEEPSSNIHSNDIIKLAEFVLSNNFFEFQRQVRQQISGTVINTKFAPPSAYIYMNKTETDFLRSKLFSHLYGLVISTIYFLSGRMGKIY